MMLVDLSTLVPATCASVKQASYRGHGCLCLSSSGGGAPGAAVALLRGHRFSDGVVAVEVASQIAEGAGEFARGFIGCLFRGAEDNSTYDCFFLRPTNARADDQVRRNHTLQYVCEPEWPWHRLRGETPERYESYADMEAGEWTPMRIEVSAASARLFVNDAVQPSLIVNDLKGSGEGLIGLWIGPGTIGYFRDLRVT